MATASGFFDHDAGSGSTVVVTGLPFRPRAALFFSLAPVNDFAQPGNYEFVIGLATRDGAQAAQQFLAGAGSPGHFNDCTCVYTTGRVVTYNSSSDGLEITSWDSHGWTFDRTGGEARVFWVAWGGAQLRTAGGEFDVLASGADTVVSGLGLGGAPGLLLALPGRSSGSEAWASLGAAVAGAQWSTAYHAAENPARGSDVFWDDSIFLSQCDAELSSEWSAELDSMDADGFTISPIVAPASDETVFFIALHDAHPDSGFAVGSELWDGPSVATAITGLGFAPEGVVLSAPLTIGPGGGFPSGMFGVGFETADGSGNITGGVMWNSIADSDPYVPPRYSLEETGGAAAALWVPPTIFGLPPSPNPATKVGDIQIDFDPDGFTANQTTDQQVTPVGNLPSSSWPASPATPWFWIAAHTSPDRRRGALPVLGVG